MHAELEHATQALRRGEVVAVATDTVYGLVCDPRNPAAVRQVFELKGRGYDKPLQVLAATVEQAHALIGLPASAKRLTKLWPGALTIVGQAKVQFAPGVGAEMRGRTTLGVRVPSSPTVLKLLLAFGPLAATSANHSGRPEALRAADVRRTFRTGLAGILGNDREVMVRVGSTVVDVTGAAPKMLRQGAVRLRHA
ncbi:MAG: L-threonylcarbamoyladenylate synthase [Candidatus Andersenbacteria bacterium]